MVKNIHKVKNRSRKERRAVAGDDMEDSLSDLLVNYFVFFFCNDTTKQ